MNKSKTNGQSYDKSAPIGNGEKADSKRGSDSKDEVVHDDTIMGNRIDLLLIDSFNDGQRKETSHLSSRFLKKSSKDIW